LTPVESPMKSMCKGQYRLLKTDVERQVIWLM